MTACAFTGGHRLGCFNCRRSAGAQECGIPVRCLQTRSTGGLLPRTDLEHLTLMCSVSAAKEVVEAFVGIDGAEGFADGVNQSFECSGRDAT